MTLTPGATALFGTLVATYDGDTPQAERPALRRDARILLTNPDMLHQAVMPNHAQWAHVLGALRYVAIDEANPNPNRNPNPQPQPQPRPQPLTRYVVVDEAHMYRGVFGCHVALILRRLRRLATLYGAAPRFVCCSATVGNPREVRAVHGMGVECALRCAQYVHGMGAWSCARYMRGMRMLVCMACGYPAPAIHRAHRPRPSATAHRG